MDGDEKKTRQPHDRHEDGCEDRDQKWMEADVVGLEFEVGQY